MYRILLYIFILISTTAAASPASDLKKKQRQMKEDISSIRSNIKNGKDLEKSASKVREYLSDSLYHNDHTLNLLAIDIERKMFDVENEKMYLKQKADTTKLITTTRSMFLAYEHFDSIDAKGSSSYRRKHAEYLKPYRKNLFKGALFFFNKKQWREAWQCIDTYLDCNNQPLFSSITLDEKNDSYAAYVALVAANNICDLDMALKYADKATTYKPAKEIPLLTIAELCYIKNDSINYTKYLKEGYRNNPRSEYFFPRLIEYYTAKKKYTRAMEIADEALKSDSTSTMFLLAKHSLLMDMQRYSEALDYGLRVLKADANISMANYNVGLIYYINARETSNAKGKNYRQRQKDAQKWYKKCCPYMEKYRQLNPNKRDIWRPILYDVYLNLNMGKEFEEVQQ